MRSKRPAVEQDEDLAQVVAGHGPCTCRSWRWLLSYSFTAIGVFFVGVLIARLAGLYPPVKK
jgi:hypothetical protein